MARRRNKIHFQDQQTFNFRLKEKPVRLRYIWSGVGGAYLKYGSRKVRVVSIKIKSSVLSDCYDSASFLKTQVKQSVEVLRLLLTLATAENP